MAVRRALFGKPRFVRIRLRVDTVSQDHLTAVAPVESDRHGNDNFAPLPTNCNLAAATANSGSRVWLSESAAVRCDFGVFVRFDLAIFSLAHWGRVRDDLFDPVGSKMEVDALLGNSECC